MTLWKELRHHVAPLRRLAAIAIMVVEIYLICNVTLQDQVFNGLCDLIGGIFLSLMSIARPHMSKGLVNLWKEASHFVSPRCQV